MERDTKIITDNIQNSEHNHSEHHHSGEHSGSKHSHSEHHHSSEHSGSEHSHSEHHHSSEHSGSEHSHSEHHHSSEHSGSEHSHSEHHHNSKHSGSEHSHSEHRHSSNHHRSHSNSRKKLRKSSYGKRTHVKNLFNKIITGFNKESLSSKNRRILKNISHKYKKMSTADKIKVFSVYGVILCCIIAAIVIYVIKFNHVHEFGEWVVTSEPTCSLPGSQSRSCKCGETQTKVLTKEHDLKFVDFDEEDGMSELSCSSCDYTEKRIPVYNEIGMPVMSINTELVSKDKYNSATVTYSSEKNSFECDAQIKYQGSTSLKYDKKNYNIKLKISDGNKYKVEMCEGWGKHSKYCLKANYCDASALRNICSAKIYGQMARTGNRTDYFTSLVNGGATDGFPIVLYVNGEFNGLYMLNIPKDEWMFNFKDGDGKKAILFASSWGGVTNLSDKVNYYLKNNGFEMTYCSTDKDYMWAVDSFNEFIDFINKSDDKTFISGISEYTELDAAIDTMLFTYSIGATDNISKNILWVTVDGKKWTPIPYDLDLTWGLTSQGNEFTNEKYMSRNMNGNKLFERLQNCMNERVKGRYTELQSSVLNTDNVSKVFSSFRSTIPDSVVYMEHTLWSDKPNIAANSIEQIVEFAGKRFSYLSENFR